MRVRSLTAYRRLQELVKRASAAGWSLDVPSPGADEPPDDGAAIYLCDYESGRLILILLRSSAFKQVNQLMERSRFSFEQACNALGSLIDDVIDQNELTEDIRSALTLTAAAYVRGTKTYETLRGQSRAQFLVVRYRWAGMLRPAAVVRDGKLLSPEELEAFVANVVAIDRQRHPDWFPRAEVVPFRLREEPIR